MEVILFYLNEELCSQKSDILSDFLRFFNLTSLTLFLFFPPKYNFIVFKKFDIVSRLKIIENIETKSFEYQLQTTCKFIHTMEYFFFIFTILPILSIQGIIKCFSMKVILCDRKYYFFNLKGSKIKVTLR